MCHMKRWYIQVDELGKGEGILGAEGLAIVTIFKNSMGDGVNEWGVGAT